MHCYSTRIRTILGLGFALFLTLLPAQVSYSQCAPPVAPRLISPADGGSNVSIPVTFTWEKTSGAYDIFIRTSTLPGTTADNSSPILTESYSKTFPLNTRVDWYIVARSIDPRCTETKASAGWSFQTTACPAPATLSAPKNGETGVSDPPSFQWSPVPGTEEFNIFIGVNGKPPEKRNKVAEIPASKPEWSGTTIGEGGARVVWYVESVARDCAAPNRSAEGTFTTACPLAAQLNSPANNAVDAPTTPTLRWNAVANAEGFEVWISENGAAARLAATLPRTATSYEPTFAYGTRVEWWVVTGSANGCPQPSSQHFFFTVLCPAAATLNLPADGAENQSRNITLSWSAVLGATGFDVFIGRNGATPTRVNAVPLPATQISYATSFAAGTAVVWYVDTLSTCTNRSSAQRTFGVACPPAVKLSAPTDRATGVPVDVRFQWIAVEDATYNIWIGRNGEAPKVANPVPLRDPVYEERFSNGVEVQWYVETVAPAPCTNQLSEKRTFRTAEACPVAVHLQQPADRATGVADPVAFAWSESGDGNGYNIFIGVNGETPRQMNPTPIGRTTPRWEEKIGTGVDVEWYVQTLATAPCPNVDSVRRKFRTAEACPGAPGLIAPADGAILADRVTFTWQTDNSAAGYHIFIGLNEETPRQANTALLTTGTFEQTFSAGVTVDWFVQMVAREGCTHRNSVTRQFRIAACPEVVELSEPADRATGVVDPATMIWKASTNAIGYNIFIGLNGAPPAKVNTVLIPPSVTAWTERIGANTEVAWYVEALAKDCTPLKSAQRTYRTAQACPASITLLSPANGAGNLIDPVSFSWNSVTGATSFNIYIGKDGQAPVKANASPIPATSTGWSEKIGPSVRVEWYVEALGDPSCNAIVSSRFTFTTAGNCPLAVELFSPKDGAENVSDPVSFGWSLSNDATGYNIYIGKNGARPVRANATVLETGKWIEKVGPGVRVEWFVEALGRSDCTPAQSKSSFFVSGSAPECPGTEVSLRLESPAAGAEVSAPVTFSWAALGGTSGYRLWLVSDGGSATLLGTTTGVNLTASVAAGSGEWFVEAMFAQCPPILSERRKITIRRAASCDNNRAPELSSPADRAEVISANVNFRWAEAPGAIGYVLYVSLSSGGFFDIAKTKTTDVTLELKPGTVDWLVEAQFEGCPSLRSGPRRVTISDQACPRQAPVLNEPRGGSSPASPVRFSWEPVLDVATYRLWLSSGGEYIVAATTPETSVSRGLDPGQYSWYVEAVLDRCPSTFSDKSAFIVERQATCVTDRPTLLSPADHATLTGLAAEFSWGAVGGAISYELWIQPRDGTPTLLAETEKTAVRRTLNADTYAWFVRAQFAGCPRRESAHFEFSVEPPVVCSDQQSVLVSPGENARMVTTPTLRWTNVGGATRYQVFASIDNAPGILIGITETTALKVDLPFGRIRWWVTSEFGNSCSPTESARSVFFREEPPDPCPQVTSQVVASVVGNTTSGSEFFVRWSELAGVDVYELQEADNPDFENAFTEILTSSSAARRKTVNDSAIYYYRVRGRNKCTGEATIYSVPIAILVAPSSSNDVLLTNSLEIGSGATLVQHIVVLGAPGASFTATADQPWVRLVPSSGTFPAEGRVTIEVITDTSTFSTGTHEAMVTVTTLAASKSALNGGKTTVPVSVNLVTPITPVPKNGTPPDALIIPVVAHAEGASNSLFESDVRLTNTSAQPIRYQVTFTPSNSDSTRNGRQTTVDVGAGQTLALDDILKNVFGIGAAGSGSLEIRPLNAPASSDPNSPIRKNSVASSRTYNFTTAGTFGQFIPAVPFRDFVGRLSASGVPDILTLQQISQSAAYRTNFGVVEGAGEPADIVITVYDAANQKLREIPLSLKPGEHQQINGILALNNVVLQDGRLEVQVRSNTGRITAYASVIDNLTNDPMLVPAVSRSRPGADRYIVPGVADLNAALANFRTDMRIFNAESITVNATLDYYAQGQSEPIKSIQKQLNPGEVIALNDVLRSEFGLTGTGGAIQIRTTGAANLVATARTYSLAENGSFGQFIPAVTSEDAIGLGDGALQVIQMEESERFRSNLGLVEVTGKPVSLEISAYVSGSKSAPRMILNLGANEFRQVGQVLKVLGAGASYNSRLSVRVIGGEGRVAAYGSMIDNLTQDPTYVPAQ